MDLVLGLALTDGRTVPVLYFVLCLCDVLKAMSWNHSGSVLLLAPGRHLPDRDLSPL